MFAYDHEVSERFPGIRAVVVHATGLSNGHSPQELLDEYQAGQRTVVRKLGDTAIADLPSISAWRRVFAEFGAKPTRYRNAAEALLRRLSKQGDIPTVNTLVDMGNLVSIRYAMPVAVFDRDNVAGTITVRFAAGDEPFADLGCSDTVQPNPGEVVFVDGEGVVCARRWCWRQGATSATSEDTTDALFVVEGHHDTAEQDVEAALRDLTSLLASYQPRVQIESYALSPARPRAKEPPKDL